MPGNLLVRRHMKCNNKFLTIHLKKRGFEVGGGWFLRKIFSSKRREERLNLVTFCPQPKKTVFTPPIFCPRHGSGNWIFSLIATYNFLFSTFDFFSATFHPLSYLFGWTTDSQTKNEWYGVIFLSAWIEIFYCRSFVFFPHPKNRIP